MMASESAPPEEERMLGDLPKRKPQETAGLNMIPNLRAAGLIVIAILAIVALYFIGAALIKDLAH